MLLYIFRQSMRRPLFLLALLLFSGCIASVLCGLQVSNQQAQAHYNSIYDTIEVRCRVTTMTGSRSDNLRMSMHDVKYFTDQYGASSDHISDMVTDVQIKGQQGLDGDFRAYTLYGITSVELVSALHIDNGGHISWYAGFDESMLPNDEAFCIIPDIMMNRVQDGAIALPVLMGYSAEPQEIILPVGGVYQGRDIRGIYCPFSVLAELWHSSREPVGSIMAINARVVNNHCIDQLSEKAAANYPPPDPSSVSSSQSYALYIDDARLVQAQQTLQNSLLMSNITSVLVLVITACAGFFLGFLIVRQRGREIALMRTMGTPNPAIYTGFVVEQLLSVTLGAFIGGAYFLWQPLERLLLFIGVYFIGLTAALVIFLNKNLMTTIKEEE